MIAWYDLDCHCKPSFLQYSFGPKQSFLPWPLRNGSTCWRPGKYNSCWKANGSHRHKKKKLMWKWSDVKLLNLVAVRLFLGPPKSPRRRMFCKQMVDFVTVRYICSHMFLWQCFVILIIRIRLVNSYLFCFSSFSKFRFWIQYQSVTLSETSEVWNTWAATQAHSA